MLRLLFRELEKIRTKPEGGTNVLFSCRWWYCRWWQCLPAVTPLIPGEIVSALFSDAIHHKTNEKKNIQEEKHRVPYLIEILVQLEPDDAAEAADPEHGVLEIEELPRPLRRVVRGTCQPERIERTVVEEGSARRQRKTQGRR